MSSAESTLKYNEPHDDPGYLGSDGSMIGKLFDGNDVLKAHRDSCPFKDQCEYRGPHDCKHECEYQIIFKELLKENSSKE